MNRFSLNILLRILLLILTITAGCWLWWSGYQLVVLLVVPLLLMQVFALYHYLNRVNRKLTLFLEAIRYEDFSIRFSADNKLGKSFSALNHQFNEVLEAFRQTRAEREANLKYIDTIIQHISIGILSFDGDGKIELINPAAFRLMGIYRLRYLDELKLPHPELAETLLQLPAGSKALYATQNGQQLTIQATTVRLQGRLIKLISLQNIHAELQQKELEAWQNLTKILRHEIMNSVTPIVSLIGTMREIVEHDMGPTPEQTEAVEDLKEALETIESRSKGIMNFVNAYRDYTTLPKPQFTNINLKQLINSVSNLLQSDIRAAGITYTAHVSPDNIEIHADENTAADGAHQPHQKRHGCAGAYRKAAHPGKRRHGQRAADHHRSHRQRARHRARVGWTRAHRHAPTGRRLRWPTPGGPAPRRRLARPHAPAHGGEVIRLLLADDQPMLRLGFRMVFETQRTLK